MAKKFANGEYALKNPAKYMGTLPVIYRSSWEISVMKVFDENPHVLGWSSESIQIPYFNPLKRAWSIYIPDFFVVFVDKAGNKRAEMIEVKPFKEVPWANNKRSSQQTKAAQMVNQCKWTAAIKFCAKRGWNFRVATERELFGYKK